MFCRLFTTRSAEGQSEGITQTEGSLQENKVVQATNQTNKAWFITAIGVGAFIVVGAGGFGALGLAHSYGLISLPNWLTPALNAVGQTSHFWSLWTMTAGGLVVGGTLITYGAVKIHHSRKVEKETSTDEENDDAEGIKKERLDYQRRYNEAMKQFAQAYELGSEEADVNEFVDYYKKELEPGSFKIAQLPYEEKDGSYLIVLRTHLDQEAKSELKISPSMNLESCKEFAQRLTKLGFKDVSPAASEGSPLKLEDPMEKFGDNFETVRLEKERYDELAENCYTFVKTHAGDQYVLIMKNDKNQLFCTEKIDRDTYDKLSRHLNDLDYQCVNLFA